MIIKTLKDNKLYAVSLLLTFIGIYILNRYYPFCIDDWSYAKSYSDGSVIPPAGVIEIIKSQYAYYRIWGGRSVVHFIAQFMISLGKFWAGILNSLAYTALVFVMCKYANCGKKNTVIIVIIANMIIWYLPPMLVANVLWITGSANYLWGILLVVLFIYPFYSYFISDGKNYTKINYLLIFVAGVLAGWTNENTGIGLIFFLICFVLLMKYNKMSIPKWMYVGLFGAIVGCAFMICAPGNFARYELSLAGQGVYENEEPFYLYYFYRSVSVFKNYIMYGLLPTLLYLATFGVFAYTYKREDKKKLMSISLLFLLTAMVSIAAMIAAPIFPLRVWFGIIILMGIGALILYTNIRIEYRPVRLVSNVLFTAFTLFFIFSYFATVVETKRVFGLLKEREARIQEQVDKGVKRIYIYGKLDSKDSFYLGPRVSDLPLDSTHWIGVAYGGYFGVERIIVIDTLKHE